ncbi:MAG: hypothetical protein AMXMBFR64_00710 [Myxococcales bacterium]
MTEQIPPRGLVTQTALVVVLGALVGLGAHAASAPDFDAALAPPAQADSSEIARLREETPQAPTSDADVAPERPRVVIPKRVSFIDLRSQLYAQPGVSIIDARDRSSYEGGHIPGSLHLDLDDLERDPNAGGPVLAQVPRTDVVVVYCSGGDCDISMRLARKLIARGYDKVLVYEGGWTEWLQEDGTRATGAEPGTPDGG